MEYQPYSGSSPAKPVTADAMTFDVNSRLAREQIARQIAHSSTYRRQQQQQSRVFKPASTGSSPQNLARRRHAAGPRLCSAPVDAAHHIRRRAVTSATGRPNSMLSESRPSSWHSNSAAVAVEDPYVTRHSMCELAQQQQQQQQHFMHYRTVAMNGLPTPMTHAELSNTPLDHCFSLDSSPTFQQGYVHMPVSDDWCTEPSNMGQLLTPASNSQPAPASYPLDYVQASFAMYSQMMNAPFSGMNSGLAVHTAPPTPDMLPIQQPDEDLSADDSAEENEDEQDGPELVGMGLYDSTPSSSMHDHESMSTFNGGSPGGANKMLKLCDAWTPPEDNKSEDGDAEDDDEEDEMSEEEDSEEDNDEEEEEDVLAFGDVSNAGRPADMSSKSFFFDEAEPVGIATFTETTHSNWSMMTPTWT